MSAFHNYRLSLEPDKVQFSCASHVMGCPVGNASVVGDWRMRLTAISNDGDAIGCPGGEKMEIGDVSHSLVRRNSNASDIEVQMREGEI